MTERRVCLHPHPCAGWMDQSWIAEMEVKPVAPHHLVLHTDMGFMPYCGMDNTRAMVSANLLGIRFERAKLVSYFEIRPGEGDYAENRWLRPHMFLSLGLAEFEERFCVADRLRERLGLPT